jgi:hypothetical protein
MRRPPGFPLLLACLLTPRTPDDRQQRLAQDADQVKVVCEHKKDVHEFAAGGGRRGMCQMSENDSHSWCRSSAGNGQAKKASMRSCACAEFFWRCGAMACRAAWR